MAAVITSLQTNFPTLVPGYPQLPAGAPAAIIAAAVSEIASSSLWQSAAEPPTWGVFDSRGNQVLFPDTILEFDDRQEYEIPNYPIQDGGFGSYNKVIRPEEIQLRFMKTGTEDERADFLADIKRMVASTLLFTVITPEVVYTDLNPIRREVARRGPKGAYQLTEVDVYFEQVNLVQAQYTTTAVQLPNATDDAAKPQSSVGVVQPQAASTQLQQDGQQALATAALGPPGSY